MASRPKLCYTSAEMAELILADNDENSDNLFCQTILHTETVMRILNKLFFLLLTQTNHAVMFVAVTLNQMKMATLAFLLMQLIMQQKILLQNGENIHHVEQVDQKREMLSRKQDHQTMFQHPLHLQKMLLV